MKRLFILLVMALAMETSSAVEPFQEGLVQLTLCVRPIKPIGGHFPFPKSPVEAPCVYQDGSLLIFESELEGCTVFLVDEDENVVFSESIEENQTSLTMPSYLSGTYLLEIISGNYVFYCEIEL